MQGLEFRGAAGCWRDEVPGLQGLWGARGLQGLGCMGAAVVRARGCTGTAGALWCMGAAGAWVHGGCRGSRLHGVAGSRCIGSGVQWDKSVWSLQRLWVHGGSADFGVREAYCGSGLGVWTAGGQRCMEINDRDRWLGRSCAEQERCMGIQENGCREDKGRDSWGPEGG